MKNILFFSGLIVAMGLTINAQTTLTDSLVAYYPFNGNANDESGNGNDGTVNGAILTIDRFGNPNSAYDFDSSYIDCNDPLLPASGDWTVNIWINPDILDTVNPTVIWGQYEYPIIGRIMLAFDNTRENKIKSSWGSDSSAEYMFLNSDIQPQLNKWQMITLIRKDSTLSIYDNGKFSGATDSLFVDIMQTHNFYIGLHHSNYLNCCAFKGKLDDARIYNRAIKPDEIDSLYHEGGWYPADTTPPAQPTGLFANTGNTQVTLQWNQNPEADVVKYRMYVGTSSPATTLIDSLTGTPPDTTYTDTGLTNGQEYFYRITAVDTAGNESPFSDEIHVTPTIVATGLVAFYPFNSNARDESGNSHDGTIKGDVLLSTDRFGNTASTYTFDGVNDAIDVNSFTPGLDALTISAWVYPVYGEDYYKFIFNKQNPATATNSNGDINLLIDTTDVYGGIRTVYFGIFENNQWHTTYTTTTLNYNEWSYVVCTWDKNTNNGKARIYINGTEAAYGSQPQMQFDITNNSDPVRIGARTSTTSTYSYEFSGGIDDIRIYNRALSETEINSFYHLGGWPPADTTPPSKPTGLFANTGNTQVSLKWNKNQEADVAKYRIYRGTSSPASTLIDSITGTPPDTTFTDTGLTNGQEYFYRITAVDTAGNESPFSDEIHVTPTIVATGLVAFYPFNGNANDESGNGDGTVNGATLTADRFGNENSAYSFDGVNNYVETNYTGLLDMNNESFSISVFVKPSQIPGATYGYIMRYGGNSQTSTQTTYCIRSFNNRYFDFEIEYGPGNTYYAYSDTFNSQSEYESWHHIVCIRDNENAKMKFYLDGVLKEEVSSGSGGWSNLADPRTLFIGASDMSPDEGKLFSGIMDDIRIYNRVLSDAEIDSLYHLGGWPFEDITPPARPTGLIANTGNTEVTLKWNKNPEADVVKYFIYSGSTSPANTLIDSITGTPPDTTFTDTGLTNGQEYFYRITAVDTAGNESPFSDEIHVIPTDIATGMIAWYTFNGNADDVSRNGNDGTVNEATLTTDRFGNEHAAYNFNGIDNFIDCGHNGTQVFSNALTITSWIRTTASGELQFIFSKWGGSNDNESFYLALKENGVPYGKINFNDTQEIEPISSFPVNDGQWHMLAMTYNGDSAVYFVDNIAVVIIYDTRSILSGTLPLMIGDDNANHKRFNGQIDDCMLFNVALSLSEIDSLYHLGGWSTDTTDLAVKWISPIAPACGTAKEEAITLRVINMGNVTVNQYELSYSVDSGNFFINEMVTQPLAVGDSMDYTFNHKADMSEVTTFHCVAAVHASNDLNSTNDTSTIDVQNLSISFTVQTSATSCNDSTGGAGISGITGGTSPYQYTWTTGDTTNVANSLASGVYQVTVTDANGCSTTETFSITASGGPAILSSDIQNVTCYGGNNGTVDITVFGGAPPYSYLWSTGATTEDVSGLSAGTYDVTITDVNLCSNTISFTLTQPDQLSVNITETDAACGNSDGQATAFVTGGTSPYAYSWSDGGTSQTETGLTGGIYQVIVTDANGCYVTKDVTVSETGAPVITLESISPAHCGLPDGAIDITVSGGTGSYIYSWSSGYTGEDLSGAAPGDYTVSVTHSDNSCTSSAAFTIPSVKPDPVPVCMITVDSATNRNMVVWEKPAEPGDISSFNIYREGSVAGEFLLIGNVKYADESVFIDSVADPDVRSWRYRISTLDGCGNESDKSDAHKTIHLSMNLGVGNTINLAWDDYKGFAYSTYHIYRYANPLFNAENLDNLAASGSGYNSYVDNNPPDGDVYYVITIDPPTPCITSRKTGSHNSVRSNKKKREAPGWIASSDELFHSLSIYPNPNSGSFTVQGSLITPGDLDIRIFGATGNLVYILKLHPRNGTFSEEITLPGAVSGVYHVEFITREGVTHKIVVVQ